MFPRSVVLGIIDGLEVGGVGRVVAARGAFYRRRARAGGSGIGSGVGGSASSGNARHDGLGRRWQGSMCGSGGCGERTERAGQVGVVVCVVVYVVVVVIVLVLVF